MGSGAQVPPSLALHTSGHGIETGYIQNSYPAGVAHNR